MECKLSAIVDADVEDNGRLMGEDEEGRLEALTEYREVMSNHIEKHRHPIVFFRITFVFFLLLSFILFSGFRNVLKSPQSEKIDPSIKPSIAVLPFLDLSPEKDQEYFSDGIAEEILNTLTKVEGLRVAARTSSFAFKGRNKDILTIGERLNVDYVLEGSVRKAGNTIRITVELINVADGFQLWAEKYDRELTSVFAIQDEISQAIATALQIEIIGNAGDPLVKTSTTNIEAYDHYLFGRYHWMKRTAKGLITAIEHFDQAIAIDPNYALAYSGLADVYLVLPAYIANSDRATIKAHAEEAVKKALAINPYLAEAHTSLGYTRETFHSDYKGAENEYRRAIELNRKYASAYYRYSYFLLLTERLEEAIAKGRKALELEPFSLLYNHHLGLTHYYARHFDTAILIFESTLELDPNYHFTWEFMGLTFLFKERFEDAAHALNRWAELTGRDKEMLKLYVSLVEKHARTGESVAYPPEWESVFPYYFYTFLGDKERNLDAIEQAFEEKNYYFLFSPEYDFLRSEPRFITLERKRKQVLGLEE